MNLGINLWYVLLAIVAGALLIFALGWHSSTGWHEKRARRVVIYPDEMQQLAEQRAPMPTYRGWLFDTAWHPVQRDTAPMSMVDALDMADAAYRLGENRVLADQAETRAEAEAIWAEVEADPKRWQTCGICGKDGGEH